jgi:hypothetical protein
VFDVAYRPHAVQAQMAYMLSAAARPVLADITLTLPGGLRWGLGAGGWGLGMGMGLWEGLGRVLLGAWLVGGVCGGVGWCVAAFGCRRLAPGNVRAAGRAPARRLRACPDRHRPHLITHQA